MRTPSNSFSVRLYGLLLRLYPPGFREEYGTPLEQQFQDEYRECLEREGLRGVLRLWFRIAWDLLRTAPSELGREMARDARYGIRTLSKTPGCTLAVTLTLALGVGANTSIFSLFNAAVLRSPQVQDAKSLAIVYRQVLDDSGSGPLSDAAYADLRDHSQSFANLIAYAPAKVGLRNSDSGSSSSCPSDSGEAIEVRSLLISWNYIPALGGNVQLGRDLRTEDQGRTAAPVAVLSDRLWRRCLRGDPSAVGRVVYINAQPVQVVGIAGTEFSGLDPTAELWMPLTTRPLLMGRRAQSGMAINWLSVAGHLKKGISLKEAQLEVQTHFARISPGNNPHTRLTVTTAIGALKPGARGQAVMTGLLALLAAVLVLLIACANIASLLLARATTRSREIAIRLSIGATPARLVRQFLTESMLMALLGGAAGLALGSWGARALLAAGNGPDFLNVNPDLRVVGYTLTLSMVAGFGFGLVHALQASAPGISTRLKKGRVPWGKGWRRFNSQQLLVMAQISVCFVLLISAGSLVRVLQRLQSIDPGIETKSVGVVSFDLRRQGYSNSQAAEFHAGIMADLRALPGIESAALTSTVPLSGGRRMAPVVIEGRTMGQETNGANFNEVSPSFFRTLGINIVRGRAFSDLETGDDTPVAVISETMARRYWAGEDPLGKRFRVASSAKAFTVLGVAKDIRSVELSETDGPSFYTQMSNQSIGQIGAKLLVRAKTPDDWLAVRRLLESMEGKPRGSLTPLNANLTRWIEPARLGLLLAGAFGFVALVLSCIGVYGITAFAVTSRRHEIAVRLAVGAPARRVIRDVLRQEMRPVALGIGLGAVLTVPSALLLSKVLYGVGPLDLQTLAGVCLLLAVVALMAAAIPAQRVTLVDPLSALRNE